jgi:murein DD-endopeptidase MepM/ murein hydrolase activator NlpD
LTAALVVALMTLAVGPARADEPTLTDELARLAVAHGVEIKGIGKTAGIAAPAAGGGLRARLEALLADFDHVMIQRLGGPVERVIIVARRSRDVAPVIAEAPVGVPELTLASAPVAGARISSGYGPRLHPVLGYSKMHRGIDFALPRGAPVHAVADGVVVEAGRRGAYGNYVRIRHDARTETAYAHLSAFAEALRVGTRVWRGQVIGAVGSTGRSTGAHLHYEVLIDGRQVDPRTAELPSDNGRDG